MEADNDCVYVSSTDQVDKSIPSTTNQKFQFPFKKKNVIYIDDDEPDLPIPLIPQEPIVNDVEEKTDVNVVEEKPVIGDVRYISGVQVEFPVKPYGAQIALMGKVIRGITNSQNCLLESPTGSGKTLALLCSALAWRKHEKDRISNLLLKAAIAAKAQQRTPTKYPTSPQKDNRVKPKFTIDLDSDEENLFKNVSTAKKRVELTPDEKDDVKIHKRQRISPIKSTSDDSESSPSKLSDESEPISTRIPKIYFGTRTHKQIGQVIKELKKTSYAKNLKMTILSSREHTCIRDLAPNFRSKLEMCRDLLDKSKRMGGDKNRGDYDPTTRMTGCKHFDNKAALIGPGRTPKDVWDIEELVDLGRKRKACPYFAARDMLINADIVFCPYNYILDPLIRSSTKIDLNNDILLIDEAHNIEDVCRDSASVTVESNAIDDAISDIEILIKRGESGVNHNFSDLYSIRKSLMSWHDWFENHTPLIQKQKNMELSYNMSGAELSSSLSSHSIGNKELPEFLMCVSNVLSKLGDKPDNAKLNIKILTAVLLETIITGLSFFFRNECKNLDDYIGYLIKKEEWESKPQNNFGWLSKPQRNKSTPSSFTLSLNLKCMNPAVVFSPIEKNVRCIVLASGTLTPTQSFPTELGADFPITLQANHVITPKQVWVGSVYCGPNNVSTESTYQYTSRTDWQDSLGNILLWICSNVPHGVLCFLPSYRLIDILRERWQSTGVWNEIDEIKTIFTESKKMKEHDGIMSDYYSCIEVDQGALLLAVFRGKVSEGMDFKDQQARAVITVGIPYPNVKDAMIENKMRYNESYRINKNLLPGREWLQIQAYRALNQALGRCIRHRHDWGAVIMLDSRFQNPTHTKHISKWVRNFLGENHHSWDSLTSGPNNLKAFMDRMSLDDKPSFN